MRKGALLALVVLSCCARIFSQTDSTVRFTVEAARITAGEYRLTIHTHITPGWRLFGNNPSVEGLHAPQLAFGYEHAHALGTPVSPQTVQHFNDPVFKQVEVYTGDPVFTQTVRIDSTVPATLKGTITAFLSKGDEYPQAEQPFEVTLEGGQAAETIAIRIPSIQVEHPLTDCVQRNETRNSGWLAVFLLGFLGGLIALLTPCVFPMIPITVSFFTKRSSSKKQAIRNGFLYGLFILVIYMLASVPFHILGNVQPEIFNNISTNPWLNIAFFVIFIIFAISFFGYFEITLPSSIAGKADSRSGLGSMGGIFFMALTLAVVSFSCTGPILGSLLVGSLSGGAWQLTSGLAGFGLALALPFGLFAVFPEWLKSLPRSGGWLDTVKKVLAFAEVALAFKFLSNADLVMHWGLIKRETFFAIWIVTGIGLVLYLFGLLRLPHDTKGKIGAARKVLAGLAVLFVLYLVPGVTPTKYANLQLLSGFPPPLSYSVYGRQNIQNKGLEANVVNDYDKALSMAKEQGKPLLIDFTGWACVNCRKMEENVWTQPEVMNYIRQHFILVSLYVDDKQNLPVQERNGAYRTLKGTLKEINTVGDRWATFQTENFGQTTQPLYAIVNVGQQLVSNPVGYTPDPAAYLRWLQCGYERTVQQAVPKQ